MKRATHFCTTLSLILLSCYLLSSCASTSTASATTANATEEPAQTQHSEQGQQALAAVFENIFTVPADTQIPTRLRNPVTVKDAQDIVRSDNVALFAEADRVFAQYLQSHPNDLSNLTWHAQMFLAWADGAALTQKTLSSSIERLQKKQAKLQAKIESGGSNLATQEAQIALDELEWLLPLTQKVVADLDQVAKEKLAIGQQKAQAILAHHTQTYEGYRLAADYYRQTEDWEKFDDAMQHLNTLNPESNGLQFLRGVVLFSRDKNYAEAEQALRTAVSNDAGFAKAHYYLALALLNQRKFDAAIAALDQTLETSPGHPFANAVRGYSTRLKGL